MSNKRQTALKPHLKKNKNDNIIHKTKLNFLWKVTYSTTLEESLLPVIKVVVER